MFSIFTSSITAGVDSKKAFYSAVSQGEIKAQPAVEEEKSSKKDAKETEEIPF